jgi:hypothetical protein
MSEERTNCLEPSGSAWPWDVVGWIAKYTDHFGREREYKVHGWYLNPNGNLKTHSAGVQESFFEDTVYSQNDEHTDASRKD